MKRPEKEAVKISIKEIKNYETSCENKSIIVSFGSIHRPGCTGDVCMTVLFVAESQRNLEAMGNVAITPPSFDPFAICINASKRCSNSLISSLSENARIFFSLS